MKNQTTINNAMAQATTAGTATAAAIATAIMQLLGKSLKDT